MRALVFAGAVFLALSSSAFAATVTVGGGNVSVNKGKGFKAVKSSAIAAAGDIVTAGAGGSATIVYADGCVQTVGSGETVTVGAQSPCVTGSLGGDMNNLVLGALGAAAVAAGISSVTNNPTSP